MEPESFKDFFEAVYWATVSLTTVGYGDIYPVSEAGRFVTMISAFVGVAIVALPAGIITAGYMEAFQKEHAKTKTKKKHPADPGAEAEESTADRTGCRRAGKMSLPRQRLLQII